MQCIWTHKAALILLALDTNKKDFLKRRPVEGVLLVLLVVGHIDLHAVIAQPLHLLGGQILVGVVLDILLACNISHRKGQKSSLNKNLTCSIQNSLTAYRYGSLFPKAKRVEMQTSQCCGHADGQGPWLVRCMKKLEDENLVGLSP